MEARSAYRAVLIVLIVYLVLAIVPNAISYVQLVGGGARRMHAQQAAREKKLSAADLAASLAKANRLGPDAQLRCEPARDWDYVCSYLPTALPSPKRLQFGVNVDLKRWVKVSPVVPVGTPVPAPTPGQ